MFRSLTRGTTRVTTRARWLILTVALPVLYIVIVFWATRPEPPFYTLPGKIVMDVTAPAGPAALHTVEPIYPADALLQRVEGSVKLNLVIAADGTVAAAVPFSGPAMLRAAAVACVRQWQFAAHADRAPIDIAFSLHRATTSFTPPRPIAPVYPRSATPGAVRVVAMIDPEGRVDFVHPVSGPQSLFPAAVASVKQWVFTPPLRNHEPTHATAVVDVPFQ
jgi:TonB family protein